MRQYSLDHAKGSISIFTFFIFFFYCYLTLKLHQMQWSLMLFLFYTYTINAAQSNISIPLFTPLLYFRLQYAWTIEKLFFSLSLTYNLMIFFFFFTFCFVSIEFRTSGLFQLDNRKEKWLKFCGIFHQWEIENGHCISSLIS